MKPFLSLATVLFAFVLAASLLAPPAVSFAEGEESPGQAAFLAHKCNLCHAVPAAGIEAKTKSDKMKGPELGGPIEADFEKIAAYLRKTGDLDGEQHKKEFKGTDEELKAIVDWLGSLEATE